MGELWLAQPVDGRNDQADPRSGNREVVVAGAFDRDGIHVCVLNRMDPQHGLSEAKPITGLSARRGRGWVSLRSTHATHCRRSSGRTSKPAEISG
jgi:hypothetical protein